MAAASAGSSTSSFETLSAHLHDLQLAHNILEHRVLYLEERVRDLEEGAAGTNSTVASIQSDQRIVHSRLS